MHIATKRQSNNALGNADERNAVGRQMYIHREDGKQLHSSMVRHKQWKRRLVDLLCPYTMGAPPGGPLLLLLFNSTADDDEVLGEHEKDDRKPPPLLPLLDDAAAEADDE